MDSKKVVILGSTGSIGENVLRVVQALPDRLEVVGLAVYRGVSRVLEQTAAFDVKHVAVADEDAATEARRLAPSGVTVHAGQEGVAELATMAEADVVVCAIVGVAGLAPVMAAIENGKDIALATKEVLVSAGDIVMRAAAQSGSCLLPVDSEHSAIFQCLGAEASASHTAERIRRLILTASGGPFGEQDDVDFDRVTVDEALQHPRWHMGRKITIDSATLMNKGLEVLEGHWLFGVPLDRIDVVIHPQSIVHSLVEFRDGSTLAQMSVPDMRFAIQYALTYPDRAPASLPEMDLAEIGALTFLRPDESRFPCLALAREAGRCGGTMPAVLNAANETAVEKFLARKLSFSGIWSLVAHVMSRHHVGPVTNLNDVLQADRWARETARAAAAEGIGKSGKSG